MSIEDEGGEAAPEGGPLDHFRTIAAELERNQKGGYCDKVRYRIVFKEAATPFYEIDNIEDVLLVIKDALRSIFLLFLIFYLIFDLRSNRNSPSMYSQGRVGSSGFQYRECLSL